MNVYLNDIINVYVNDITKVNFNDITKVTKVYVLMLLLTYI